MNHNQESTLHLFLLSCGIISHITIISDIQFQDSGGILEAIHNMFDPQSPVYLTIVKHSVPRRS